jgi:hypothetical protein
MKIDITIRDCTPEQARRIAAFIHTFEIDAGPVPKVKGEVVVKERVKRGKVNKYGIPPSLNTTDLKLYNRLWYRCKQHGLTYEEAMKYEKSPLNYKPKIVTGPSVVVAQGFPVQVIGALVKPTPPVPLSIAPGVQVKQIRPDNGGRMLPSVGTVMSLMSGGEIVCVKDSNGKVHKIDIRCLEVYTQTSGRDAA